MNIKKSSYMMLSLVFGVSVILYILDIPIIPSSTQMTPTISISPIVSIPTPVTNTKSLSETIVYTPEGRNESISVSLTVTNSIISELSVINSMNAGKSRSYQLSFESEIQPLVVGKDIKTLNLSRVAGASNTTDAFMQAIDKIRAKI